DSISPALSRATSENGWENGSTKRERRGGLGYAESWRLRDHRGHQGGRAAPRRKPRRDGRFVAQDPVARRNRVCYQSGRRRHPDRAARGKLERIVQEGARGEEGSEEEEDRRQEALTSSSRAPSALRREA